MAVALSAHMGALMRAALIAFSETAAVSRLSGKARRMSIAACCAVVAAAFALASVGCAIAALWVSVLPAVGPVGAPLIAAAALLLLCLALLATVARLSRHRPPPLPALAIPEAAIPALLIAQASRLVAENKGAALLAALLAGAAVGKFDPNKRAS